MVEFVTKKNIINFIINFFFRIIPLFTLFFTFVFVHVKGYAGLVYVFRNKYTCILGFLIVLIELFLKINWKYKTGLNLTGNLLFWFPVFYSALNETDIYDVTVFYYISIAIVCFCCILQLKMIRTSKSSEV